MKILTYQDILTAARIGETTDWEFKSARGGLPGSFWETYCAMANSEGGVIVLGASETESNIRLDGLSPESVARYKKNIWDGLNNRATVSCNLCENHHLQEIPLKGGILVCLTVPSAQRRQRPIFRGPSPFGNTFRRNHEGDYRCSDDEVRRMFADADPDSTSDMRILEGFSLNDLDQPSLLQYRQRIKAAKGDHPWLALDDQDLLENVGGWRRDRKKSNDGLTVAGLMMFGKFNAITDPDGVPAYWVDYREKLDPENRWSDRIYPDGTWEPNLFQFYQRVWPKISSGLPVPFMLEQGVRKDETPAHEALREAFVNALIHADYRGEGGVIVIRSSDQFAFDNPGTMLVSLEQYRRGGMSECRNKALQKMFAMIGGGERAGSGVDKIRTGWDSRHWRRPLIIINNQPDRVQLNLRMISLIPDETIHELNAMFGSRIDIVKSDEMLALATAHIEGAVSNARLQELTPSHPVDITRMLQKLCDLGFLVSDNKKRWSSYQLNGTTDNQLPLFNKINNQLPVIDSIHSSKDSIHSSKDSIHSSKDSIHSPNAEIETIVSALRGKSRVSADKMRSIIRELCSQRPFSLDQLAMILNRNATALRNQYLRPMIREGILSLQFPESPNRPDQAYTTTGNTL